MERLPSPTLTPLARHWMERRDSRLTRPLLALLATIDGQRNVIELESVARALGLRADTLDTLRRAGLLSFDTTAHG
jgi:hypothetical protein